MRQRPAPVPPAGVMAASTVLPLDGGLSYRRFDAQTGGKGVFLF